MEDEGYQRLNLVAALIGRITPDLRAVSLDCGASPIKVYFVLSNDSEEVRSEIDDVLFEFEAMQSNFPNIEADVIIDDSHCLHDIHLTGRLLFARKE